MFCSNQLSSEVLFLEKFCFYSQYGSVTFILLEKKAVFKLFAYTKFISNFLSLFFSDFFWPVSKISCLFRL